MAIELLLLQDMQISIKHSIAKLSITRDTTNEQNTKEAIDDVLLSLAGDLVKVTHRIKEIKYSKNEG